ncbi:hypothetical protein F511_01794 [Dorcoceras hygrometricum]|uniref:Uncharacterized protein n=1 Tax=Dorcoceras hygrometricum TaxID=472368 RepID=A0A2Z7AYI8_9LAMI|nr:hypothetical protein F511_01794 [Dorcoceras hygrometricum]
MSRCNARMHFGVLEDNLQGIPSKRLHLTKCDLMIIILELELSKQGLLHETECQICRYILGVEFLMLKMNKLPQLRSDTQACMLIDGVVLQVCNSDKSIRKVP